MAKSTRETRNTPISSASVAKKTEVAPPASSTEHPAKTGNLFQGLEQQRAKFAWERVQGCSKDYTNLAKAAPALIINNGLMQALAFYQSKGKAHHLALNQHLCEWLRQRGIVQQANFPGVMTALHEADAPTFRRATEETLALLKWIRQFAAAVCGDE
ncbi:MAG: type III-B CRISPR module-associated protein Cmr5 [Candidatus Competibacter sp.]|nr:type III-B CRISPR module-associated protein Cmr5 [Candidatus Competibacter sp.]MDG4605666.1 type III-B CRISPR module-associated protein Cmr5 [Candidatus Contendobacter sp.]HRD50427.1 type III-B CRISPR module-associated protein Cmr5 [Candidatus Contendobacter sp.]